MQPVHKTLLEVNEEFLVAEAPATPLLKALLEKNVLTDLDLQQLSSLEAQGARAVKRFVLHVLPLRGPLAYPALLEALQEAEAQHLVDLLLEGEAVLTAAVKPIELPDPSETPKRQQEDPNEYARKLSANRALIEEAVDPGLLVPPLLQNGVLTSLEEALLKSLQGQHVLTWSVLWGVLLQRGPRAYRAFLGALLQHGYSALFHTIEETRVKGADAMKSVLTRNIVSGAAAEDHHHLNNSNNNADDALPILPWSAAREPRTTPPLRSSSQQSMASFTSREVAPLPLNGAANKTTPRQVAGPQRPSYTLGDLDFQYTPKSKQLMRLTSSGAPDPPPADPPPQGLGSTTSTTDLLYNPAWSDPYNHLRGADVGTSPNPGYRSSVSVGEARDSENGAAAAATTTTRPSSSADPTGNPSGQFDTTLSDQHRHGDKTKEYEPSTSRRRARDDVIKDDLLLARLEAISENDFDSEAGSHASDADKTRNLSADLLARDHTPEKAEDDPDFIERSPKPEKPTGDKVPERGLI